MEDAVTAYVLSIDGDEVTLRTSESEGECLDCKLAMVCGRGRDCTFRLPRRDFGFEIACGDRVMISAVESSRYLAIAVCLLLPVVFMTGVAMLTKAYGGSDTEIALAVLGLAVLYFGAVFALRGRFGMMVKWSVKRCGDNGNKEIK